MTEKKRHSWNRWVEKIGWVKESDKIIKIKVALLSL
jgi:hypothetical protein